MKRSMMLAVLLAAASCPLFLRADASDDEGPEPNALLPSLVEARGCLDPAAEPARTSGMEKSPPVHPASFSREAAHEEETDLTVIVLSSTPLEPGAKLSLLSPASKTLVASRGIEDGAATFGGVRLGQRFRLRFTLPGFASGEGDEAIEVSRPHDVVTVRLPTLVPHAQPGEHRWAVYTLIDRKGQAWTQDRLQRAGVPLGGLELAAIPASGATHESVLRLPRFGADRREVVRGGIPVLGSFPVTLILRAESAGELASAEVGAPGERALLSFDALDVAPRTARVHFRTTQPVALVGVQDQSTGDVTTFFPAAPDADEVVAALAPGDYTFRALDAHERLFATGRLRIEEGGPRELTLELRIEPSARIEGVLLPSSIGQEIVVQAIPRDAGRCFACWFEVWADGGRYALGGLPDGGYQVVAWRLDDRHAMTLLAARTVEVSAGQVYTLDLTLDVTSTTPWTVEAAGAMQGFYLRATQTRGADPVVLFESPALQAGVTLRLPDGPVDFLGAPLRPDGQVDFSLQVEGQRRGGVVVLDFERRTAE